MTENELYSKKASLHFRNGVKAVESGCFTIAMRQLKLAKAYGYPHLKVLLYIGIIKKYKNKNRAALNHFNKIVDRGSKLPEVHLHIGNMYRLKGKKDAAMENFKIALKFSKDFLTRTLTIREIDCMQILDRSRIMGLIKICERMIDSRKRLSLNDKRAVAILEMLKGNYRTAFLKMRNLLSLDPEYAELYRDLALLHIQVRSFKRAIFALQNGLLLIKNDYEMFRMLAYCNMQLDRKCATAKVLHYMAKASLGSPALFVNMGNIFVKMSRRVAAIQSFKKALLLDAAYFPALFNLATIYHESGSLDLAQNYYEKAIDESPDDYRALYNLGILHYETGDYLASLKLLRQCLENNPTFSPAKENLRFVFMAKLCFPNECPDEDLSRISHYYWIGLGSVLAILLFTIVQGWI